METPQERLLRLEQREKKKRQDHRSKLQRQLLWVNPGTEQIGLALKAFKNGTELPNWAVPLQSELRFDEDRLYFEGLPLGLQEVTYAVRATTAGTFTLAPAHLDSARDDRFVARSASFELRVVD